MCSSWVLAYHILSIHASLPDVKELGPFSFMEASCFLVACLSMHEPLRSTTQLAVRAAVQKENSKHYACTARAVAQDVPVSSLLTPTLNPKP